MEYKAKRGIKGGVSAQVVGQELHRLIDTNGGNVLPKQVVKSAQKKSSPIHNCFTWDNTEAARLHRLYEARYLIGTITVEYEDRTVRAIVCPTIADETPLYRTIESVLTDEELREALLKQAKADLKAFRDKYNCLKELAAVFAAIDKI